MIKLVLNFKKKYNNNKYNKLKLNKLLMMMKTLRDKDIKIHFIFLDNEIMKVIIFQKQSIFIIAIHLGCSDHVA